MNNDCMCSEPRVNACAYGRIEAGIRELQRAQATRAVANCWQASVTDAGVLAVEMRRAHLRRRCVVMQIRQIRCADIVKHGVPGRISKVFERRLAPILAAAVPQACDPGPDARRSEENTSELQSLMRSSYD